MKRFVLRAALCATFAASAAAVIPATASAGGNVWVGNCYMQIFRPNFYQSSSYYSGYSSFSCPSSQSSATAYVGLYQLVTGGWQPVSNSDVVKNWGSIGGNTAYETYSNNISQVYGRWYCTYAVANISGTTAAGYSATSVQAGSTATGSCPDNP